MRKEIAVVGSEGEPEKWVKRRKYFTLASYALCRCGKSRKMPYCDGTHVTVRFDGTEKSGHKPFVKLSERLEGRELVLRDAYPLCSSARFCLAKGGIWRLTLRSNDPAKRKLAIREAGNCPSGRLVEYDKRTGRPIEPEFPPSMSLTEDPQKGVTGPIWVKGGVPVVSASGRAYEVRNRVTLCRCGKSKNKPFCDSSHVRARFNDGDKTIKRTREAAAGRQKKERPASLPLSRRALASAST